MAWPVAGLRAGKFTYATTSTGNRFTLTALKWANALVVGGSMTWNIKTGVVTANSKLKKAGRQIGTLTITWKETDSAANATMTGTINGKAVEAHRIAP